ncbi:MAG: P-II family nitrogen regulator [Sedimenticolaceae bacterium]
MKAMKRIEVILPEGEVDELIEALDATDISGYTLIPSVSGRGDRGRTLQALGHLDNSYLLVACESERMPAVVEAIRPFLGQFGGICLVSDAQWVLH